MNYFYGIGKLVFFFYCSPWNLVDLTMELLDSFEARWYRKTLVLPEARSDQFLDLPYDHILHVKCQGCSALSCLLKE